MINCSLLKDYQPTFHHIGVACETIQSDYQQYQDLGYEQVGGSFEDPNQGVKGIFIESSGQPRLELLENLPGQETLTPWINKGIKFYHFCYAVSDIEKAKDTLSQNRWITASPVKPGIVFKKVCFMMNRNNLLIELVELNETLES